MIAHRDKHGVVRVLRSIEVMKLARYASFVVVSVISVACGVSAEPDQEQPAASVEGMYRLATADSKATIREVEFRGARYALTPTGCTEESCKERGSFTIDRANHLLALVVDGTNRRVQLPFEITSAKKVQSLAGASPSASEAQSAGQLSPKAGSLVTGGQDLLVRRGVELTVSSFELENNAFTLANDDCGGRDMVTIAKSMCSDFKVPTNSPRIQCILMNDQDNCNSASKQSCLKNTDDNDALSRFDSYRSACSGEGNVALETVSSMNNGLNPFVMAVCCKSYTCPGGVLIDGSSVTGKQGQTVCGQSGTKWWCGPGGKTEGVGEWQNLNVACSR